MVAAGIAGEATTIPSFRRQAVVAGDLVTIGGHEARADRLVARFRDRLPLGDKGIDRKLAARGVSVLRRTQMVRGLVTLQFALPVMGEDKAGALAGRIKELLATGWFEYVEPDWMVRALAVPSDGAFLDGRLWALRNTGQSGGTAGADIDAERAWDITTGSAAAVVAVIDTGIRHTHQDLAANMWRNPGESGGGKETNGRDDDGNGYVDDVHGINSITGSGDPMDDNDHGSHCAGTIGAVANGGGPHVGVAWNVRLMGVKFLSRSGSGATSDAIECVNYAVARGARILSNSWGGGGFSQGLFDSIVAARDAGALFVAAAGNDSSNNDTSENYPSNYDVANVVAVAALDRMDRLADFSNYGLTTVDLGAPGVGIFSCASDSDTAYDTFDGTSMATPHVAGAAALLRGAFPSATFIELKQRLLSASRPVASLAGNCVTGGALDAHASLTVSADGILEIRAGTSQNPVPAGGTVNTFVTLSDLSPVTGATVDARFGNQSFLRLGDNGISPDAVAGDAIYSGTMTVPSGVTTLVLRVEASAPGKTPGSADFSLVVTAPPANDNFVNRALVAAGSTQSTGSNGNSSSETGEPRNPLVAGGKSVWWSWTATSSGSVTISTAGSSFDTTLAIYTGTQVSGLSLVGSNDDSGGVQSAVTFAATAGMAYAIQVDGYSGATGSITLNHPVTGAAPGAPVIVTNPTNTSVLVGQSILLAVVTQGDAPLSYQWYRNDVLVSAATSAAFSKPSAAIGDEGDYHVVVTNGKGAAVSSKAYLAVEQTAIIPDNDNFAAAAVLTGASGRIRASTRLATGEAGEPNHAATASPMASIWWKWTAGAAGTMTLDTLGSSFDTVLAAYTGASVGGLGVVASNNNSGGSVQSVVSFSVNPGTTYMIAIDGAGTAEGSVVLNYKFEPASVTVPNDDFSDREVLTGMTDEASGTNIGATGETGEADHGDQSIPLASAWWTWTAPGNGTVVIDTNRSDFDTVMAVYRGTGLGTLIELTDDDDGGDGVNSRVSLVVSTGQVLQIAVDGYGSDQGSIRVKLAFTPGSTGPPANDAFTSSFLIPAGVDEVVGTNEGASGEAGEPVHFGSSSPLNSVWWRWAAPVSGTLILDLSESDFDTVLAVYTGTSVGALTEIGGDDDGGAGVTSRLSVPVSAGRTYRIAVDGYGINAGRIVMKLGFEPTTPVSLGIALDSFGRAWTTGGGAGWTGTYLPSRDGIDAARSGTIGAGGESWMQATFTGPGALTFWWKVDGDVDYAFLNVKVGGTEIEAITGQTEWEQVTLPIPAGSQTVRWAYAKEPDSYQVGRDAGWVDQVVFTPGGFSGWIGSFPGVPSDRSGRMDDADNDGVPNLLEYFQSTSPVDPRIRGGISSPVLTAPGSFFTTFRRHKSPTGVTGSVEWSPNLVNWGTTGETIAGTRVTLLQTINTSPADHDLVTVTGTVASGPAGAIYLRLRVVQN